MAELLTDAEIDRILFALAVAGGGRDRPTPDQPAANAVIDWAHQARLNARLLGLVLAGRLLLRFDPEDGQVKFEPAEGTLPGPELKRYRRNLRDRPFGD